MKSVGLLFANANVKLTTYECTSEDDVKSVMRKTCRIYASTFRKQEFKYVVPFDALFEHDFTDAHESHQTAIFKEIYINLGLKRLTAPGFIGKITIPADFQGKVEEIQLIGSGWMCLGTQSMAVRFSTLTY